MDEFPKNNFEFEELLKISDNVELQLTVQDCSSTNVSEVYLSQKTMAEHEIWYDDSKVLLGKDGLKTACSFLTDPADDDDAVADDKIKINSVIRRKLGVSVGESVTVLKDENIPQGKIVGFRSLKECFTDLESVSISKAYLKPYFKYAFRPVHKGDILTITQGGKPIKFEITKVDPFPYCIVGPGTIIQYKDGVQETEEIRKNTLVTVPVSTMTSPSVSPALVPRKRKNLPDTAENSTTPLIKIERVENSKADGIEIEDKRVSSSSNKSTEDCSLLSKKCDNKFSSESVGEADGLKGREITSKAQDKTQGPSKNSKIASNIPTSSEQPSECNTVDLSNVTTAKKLVSNSLHSTVAVNDRSTASSNSFTSLDISKEIGKSVNTFSNLPSQRSNTMNVPQVQTNKRRSTEGNDSQSKNLCEMHQLILANEADLIQENSSLLQNWLEQFQKWKTNVKTDISNTSQSDLVNTLWKSRLLSRLGHLLMDNRKYSEFNEFTEKVLERRKMTLGPNHLKTISTQHRLAMGLFYAEEYTQSLNLFKVVCEKRNFFLGSHHRDTLRSRFYLACCLTEQEKFSEAKKFFEEVLERQKIKLPADHQDINDTQRQIARCVCRLTRHEETKTSHQDYDMLNKSMGPGATHKQQSVVSGAASKPTLPQGLRKNKSKKKILPVVRPTHYMVNGVFYQAADVSGFDEAHRRSCMTKNGTPTCYECRKTNHSAYFCDHLLRKQGLPCFPRPFTAKNF